MGLGAPGQLCYLVTHTGKSTWAKAGASPSFLFFFFVSSVKDSEVKQPEIFIAMIERRRWVASVFFKLPFMGTFTEYSHIALVSFKL